MDPLTGAKLRRNPCWIAGNHRQFSLAEGNWGGAWRKTG